MNTKHILKHSLNMQANLIIEPNNYLIIGKKGSAKSALGWELLRANVELGKRKAYAFRFPRPELLETLPFKAENINKFSQVHNLTNSVLLFDEAHRYFDVLNKKVNEILKCILAGSRQNNCSFIFITHNSYFITRGLFAYIDVRIIKEVNEGHWDIERTHMRKLYEDTQIDGKDSFFIDSGDYRGKEKFSKPAWFTDDISNAYKNKNPEENALFFDKVRRTAPESESAPSCLPRRKRSQTQKE